MKSSLATLQKDYHVLESIANRFAGSLCEQIEHVLVENKIPLGVRIDQRVKSWESIADKIERKGLELKTITDLDDLVGLRLLLLFSRDVEKTCDLLCETFEVLERENTQDRLKEDQFGYQSFHLIVSMPKGWLKIPSLKDFAGLKAEIQIRTLAQHIWGAASHFLQYKHETGVPVPVRRSIHRVSALLETVDLEFERVLQDREGYLATAKDPSKQDKLNVDLLAQILDDMLPPANKKPHEDYSELLENLRDFGISTVDSLTKMLSSTRDRVLAADAVELKKAKEGDYPCTSEERADHGVFFSHVGLARQALAEKFGHDKWDAYARRKWQGLRREPSDPGARRRK